MSSDSVCLRVPAAASYARVVRMTASNLAVLCEMDVDDVEDVRMAAEEGFVFACATEPSACDVSFELTGEEVRMAFSLGDADAESNADLDLIELLLSAVCDDFGVSEDGSELSIVKRVSTHVR